MALVSNQMNILLQLENRELPPNFYPVEGLRIFLFAYVLISPRFPHEFALIFNIEEDTSIDEIVDILADHIKEEDESKQLILLSPDDPFYERYLFDICILQKIYILLQLHIDLIDTGQLNSPQCILLKRLYFSLIESHFNFIL